MLAEERRNKILENIMREGSIHVVDACREFGVSQVTARRDLDVLASKGRVIRSRGGAVRSDLSTAFEPVYDIKRKLNQDEKKRIGNAAAGLVKEGQTLIIDSGSTSYNIVSSLKRFKSLTVITYDLIIAKELSTNSSITVIMAGGTVRNNLYSTSGPMTVDILKKLHVNIAFLTVDAVDLEYGLTNTTIEGVETKQAVIGNAEQVVLLVDHTKFGRCALAHVANIDAVDLIITDTAIPEKIVSELRMKDIKVQLV